MKTQIIIIIILFVAPFVISPKVVEAANNNICMVSTEDKDSSVKNEGCTALKQIEYKNSKKECCKNAEKKECSQTKSSDVSKNTDSQGSKCCKEARKECCKAKSADKVQNQ